MSLSFPRNFRNIYDHYCARDYHTRNSQHQLNHESVGLSRSWRVCMGEQASPHHSVSQRCHHLNYHYHYYILKGDLPSVTDGRILGHEGIGVVEQVGTAVSEFRVGDKVIISCVTACLKCDFCRKQMYSHCRQGGWILGNTIDGTQAEYVRIPHADGRLYSFPPDGADEY